VELKLRNSTLLNNVVFHLVTDSPETNAKLGTIHRTKTNQPKKTNKKLKRSDSSTDPTKNVGVNPGACDGKVVVVSYKTFIRLLIFLLW
jgi:hypothetical protein